MHREFLAATGLPSSKITNSNPKLIDEFFDDDPDDEKFLLFFLGFLLGDGSIMWNFTGTIKDLLVKFNALYFPARDRYILEYMQNRMDRLGCNTKLGVRVFKDSGQVLNFLYVYKSEVLINLMRRGIRIMKDHKIPFCGKLSLLDQLIQCYPKYIAYGYVHNVSRSYYEFLGSELYHEKTARVIAQDFFNENMFTVNEFLDVLGLDNIHSTDELSISEMMAGFVALDAKENKNEEEELVANYYRVCRDLRHAPDEIQPIDYKPRKTHYTCNFCSKIYVIHNSLIQHIKHKHSTKEYYTCNFCSKVYNYHESLIQHIKTKHSGKEFPFSCKKCTRTFKTSGQLTKHIKAVHKEKKKIYFICNVCDKEFYDQKSYEKHIKSFHVKEKKFKCPYEGCEYAGTALAHLQQHIDVIHKKLAKCDYCDRAFTQRGEFNKHMDKFHPEALVRCRYNCNLAFRTQWQLDGHVKRRHDPKRRFKCEICEETFTQNGYLKNHQNNVDCISHVRDPSFANKNKRRSSVIKKER